MGGMLAQLLRRAARALGHQPLPVYEVDRSDTGPVTATALSIAILGAGFRIDERRRSLRVTRVGRGRSPALAIVRLPRSRVLGAGPIRILASERDLVLGLLTAMSAALGTLRLHTADLGTVVVDPPSTAASPNAERAWGIVRRPRVASHYDC